MTDIDLDVIERFVRETAMRPEVRYKVLPLIAHARSLEKENKQLQAEMKQLWKMLDHTA